MAQINKITLPDGTTHNLVPGAGDIVVKSKLYFEAVDEDNVTYKKLVAEYVAPDPEDFDTAGTLTVYDLSGNTMFTMDMSGNRFNLLRVVNTLIAGTLITSDVVKPSGSTWDGTNTSLTTAISLLNSTLVKYKTHTFKNLSNSSSSAYYITLSNNIFTLLNVSEICSMYINGWGNLGKTPLSLVVENSRLYLLFNEGKTFSNGVLTVKFGYR